MINSTKICKYFLFLACFYFLQINVSFAQSLEEIEKEFQQLFDSQQVEKATKTLNKYISERLKSARPNRVNEALRMGELFSRRSKYDLSEKAFYTMKPHIVLNSDFVIYYYSLATTVKNQHRYFEALKIIDSSDVYCKLENDQENLLINNYLRALIYSDLNIYKTSNKLCFSVLEKFQKNGNSAYMNYTYGILGYNYGELKDYPKAIEYLNLSLKFTKKEDYYKKYLLIADLYLKQDRFDESRNYLLEVLKNSIQKKDPEYTILTYRYLSMVAYKQSQLDSANDYLNKAIDISHKYHFKDIYNQIIRSKTYFLTRNQDMEELGRHIHYLDSLGVKAKNLKTPMDVRITWLLNTSQLAELKKFIKINENEIDKTLRLGPFYKNIILTKIALQEHSDSAFYYYNIAASLFDEKNNHDFGEDYSKALFSTISISQIRGVIGQLLHQTEDPTFWFEANELIKAKLITNNIIKQQNQSGQIIPDSILILKENLQEKITKLNFSSDSLNQTQLLLLKNQLENLNLTWFTRHSISIKDQAVFKASISETQSKLPKESVFIHLLESYDDYHVLLISNSEVKTHHILGKKNVNNQLREYINQLRNPESQIDTALSNQILQILAGKNLNWLLTKQDWILSLDGLWLLLPIDALQYKGHFLAETHRVRSILSVSMAKALYDTKRWYTSNSLLLVSNPKYPESSTWLNLPFTEIEANSLKQKPFEIQQLSKERATISQFKHQLNQADWRYIHIAAHGVTDQNPTQNRIILSYDKDETDGLLFPHHLTNTSIKSDLVVLSACETALGEVIRGEGIWGMQRSWMASGAESVVAGFWKVNDRSTALFMDLFYTKIEDTNGVLDQIEYRFSPDFSPTYKAIAIEETKREFVKTKRYSHPYFWAGYHYSGL